MKQGRTLLELANDMAKSFKRLSAKEQAEARKNIYDKVVKKRKRKTTTGEWIQ